MPRRLFVSGTDTDAGKTHVCCELIRDLIAASFRVAAFKPICTGVTTEDSADIGRLAAATGQDEAEICPLVFRAALSPPSAASREGTRVDRDRIDRAFRRLAASDYDFLVVEGAGGVLCPVTSETSMLDLAIAWKLPLLIVAGLKLGAINHTLLSYEAAVRRGVQPRVILCEPRPTDPDVLASTVEELAGRLGSAIVGCVPFEGRLLKFHANEPTMAGRPMSVDEVIKFFDDPNQ